MGYLLEKKEKFAQRHRCAVLSTNPSRQRSKFSIGFGASQEYRSTLNTIIYPLKIENNMEKWSQLPICFAEI
ncbi:hypothetical protein RB195_016484 [Necator americanus]|uniref:Uncharacterized protein n=1 Tax=Necator americanus TaxID=51031 RepID=A0ABR1C0M7_NECAM